MKYTKKSIGEIMKLIIYVPIVILIGLFLTVGIFQIGEEFFIDNVHNITKDTGLNIGIDDSYINSLDKLKSDFQSEEPPFELLFAFILVSVFAGSLFLALKSEKLPHLSFLGSSVIGLMLLLLIITFRESLARLRTNNLRALSLISASFLVIILIYGLDLWYAQTLWLHMEVISYRYLVNQPLFNFLRFLL